MLHFLSACFAPCSRLRPCPSLQYVFAPLVQFNEDETLWPPCGGCGLGQSHQLHRRACVLSMFKLWLLRILNKHCRQR
jgi:hypothetical protein